MSHAQLWGQIAQVSMSRIVFSFVATVLMVLTAFHVMASNSSAATYVDHGTELTVIPSEEGFVEWDGHSELGHPSESEISTVAYGGTGSLKEVYGPPYSSVSSLGGVERTPILTIGNESYIFEAEGGRYVFDVSTPWSMSLVDSGTRLVKESFFTLCLEGSRLVPNDGSVLTVNSGRYVASYHVYREGSETPAASMMLDVDFTCPSGPKITASAGNLSPLLEEWRVAWLVMPGVGVTKLQARNAHTSYNPDSVVDCVIPSPDSMIDVALDKNGDANAWNSFLIDWSDAGGGDFLVEKTAPLNGTGSHLFCILFPHGQAVIDPSLVSTSSSANPTGMSCQRKVFSYGGYYWAFYEDGGRVYYSRSPDGFSWNEFLLNAVGQVVSGTGFDVYARDGKVAVAWHQNILGTNMLMFVSGTVLGAKIQWAQSAVKVARVTITPQPVTTTIGTDGTYWVGALTSSWYANPYTYYMYQVQRSFDGFTFTDTLFGPDNFTTNHASSTWCMLLPAANGRMVFLEAWSGVADDTYVRTSLCSPWLDPASGLWYTSYHNIGMRSGPKAYLFSAVATPDFSIRLAYVTSVNDIAYSKIDLLEGSSYVWHLSNSAYQVSYPTISLDDSGDIRIFYLGYSESTYSIRQEQIHGPTYTSWSSLGAFYTAPLEVTCKGLVSWVDQVASCAMIWVEGNSYVKFGSAPLPFGTPGNPMQPWNRDGISPYGTYLSSFGDYVSPGSGMLTIMQTDSKLPGRNGLDLTVSRIYQQPRYFRVSSGSTYTGGTFPFCPLDSRWSLDLPWMDKDYVYLQGGQRYVMQFGNNGIDGQFENHDGTHFLLRRFASGNSVYYELSLVSGIRYILGEPTMVSLYGFEKPIKICDSQGYDPANPFSAKNWIDLAYDSNDRLQSITDCALRTITFSYPVGGNSLGHITNPDGSSVSFGYVNSKLATVTDAGGRLTTYGYVALGSPSCYLINTVTFPTGAQNVYDYQVDYSMGTEVRSYLVSLQKTQTATGGAVVRQTAYDYTVSGGRVVFTTATLMDGSGVVQGCTDFVFKSSMKCTSETQKDATGSQKSKSVTWYDAAGQPVRIDHYSGDSQVVNYTEFMGYDDWGNVVFRKDAAGHEEYASYSNTKKENSFQGGSVLTRTASGKIMFDCFDDWDMVGWGTRLESGNTVRLDGGAGNPDAPALNITHTGYGKAVAYSSFGQQNADFIIQTSFLTSTWAPTYIEGTYGGETFSTRLMFYSVEGDFCWHDETGKHIISEVKCEHKTWYDVAFVIHYATNTYDIYIDGVRVSLQDQPGLFGTSGYIDCVYFQAGDYDTYPTYQLVDNVRIFRSLTVQVNIGNGYLAELIDSDGERIATAKSSSGVATLTFPTPPLGFPPGSIRVTKIGYYSYDSPTMDIWGGDSYIYAEGAIASSVQKTATGFGTAYNSIADDYWPGSVYTRTWYAYPNDGLEGLWDGNSNTAVSGAKYHESPYCLGPHYHGYYYGSVGMNVDANGMIVQYVWLTEGRVPAEIKLQYYYAGTWRAAWWGPSVEDLINLGSLDSRLAPSLTHWVGSMPSVTGQWIQLAVKASDLGISGRVYGVIYASSAGTVRWDFTSSDSSGLTLSGVPQGYSVDLVLDNGQTVTAAASTPTILDTYSASGGQFPLAGTFRIRSGENSIYESPWMNHIFNSDDYSYSASEFYSNQVNERIHDRLIGSFTHQDYSRTIPQKSYLRYDSSGNVEEIRSSLGADWTYTRMGYDEYGNDVWVTDSTGRMTCVQYSSTYSTYPTGLWHGGRLDTFDFSYEWNPTSERPWMTAAYTSEASYSEARSIELAFTGALNNGLDDGTAMMAWEYDGSIPVHAFSVRMYATSYYHNRDSSDLMDAGVKMRLFDEDGNYATYTYWLACWSGGLDNRTPSDPTTTKVIWGRPPIGTWLSAIMHPSEDFDVDWTECLKVQFELYVSCDGAYLDGLDIYIDDFSYDDFAKSSLSGRSYDSLTGEVVAEWDPLGRETNYSYDALGRVTWIQYDDNSRIRMEYDDETNKVVVWDELNHKTIRYFDALGRMTKVERIGGLASGNYSFEMYTHNWQDQVATYRDAGGHVTKFEYDVFGRPTKTIFPDNHYSRIEYDDFRHLVTYVSFNCSSGLATHKTVKVFDYLGRQNATREHTTLDKYNQTRMSYDAVGNLISVRDANGQWTNMTYDSQNRLKRNTYPDKRYEEVSYDATGRVIMKRDREGNETYSSYNSAGMLAESISTCDTVTHVYDCAGQLVTSKNNLGQISYEYNSRGKLSRLSEQIGTATYDIEYDWDIENRLRSLKYPDGVVITYYYDHLDRVIDVKRTTPTPTKLLLNITYNKDDTVRTETTGDSSNKKVTTYLYNSRDWPVMINMQIGGKTKQLLKYWYDDVGNVKTLLVNASDKASNAKIETYAYDWLDRITSAKGGSLPAITYKYDAVGNRIQKVEGSTTATYTYRSPANGGYNLLIGDGTWEYRYDPNLNQNWRNKSTEKWSYQWNSLDQLVKVVKGTRSGQTWAWATIGQYWYDVNGARAKTIEGTVETHYVFMGHDPLYEKSVTASVQTDYVYVNGRVKAKIITGGTSAGIYYYIQDALGSTRQVYKDGASSATFSVTTYKPFGTPVSVTGTDKVRYASELFDASSGLYYVFARYMNPELGRFISLDPQLGSLSAPQTLDRYVYCVNNPLRFTDPTGEWFGISLKQFVAVLATAAVCAALVALTVVTLGAAAPLAVVVGGAIIGAGVNTATYFASTSDSKWTLSGVAGSAVSGAISGAAIAAAPFTGGASAAFAVGAAGGMGGYAAGQLIKGEKITLGGLAISGLLGGIGGVGGQYIGKAFEKLVPGSTYGGLRNMVEAFNAEKNIPFKQILPGILGAGAYTGLWNIGKGLLRETGAYDYNPKIHIPHFRTGMGAALD